MGLEPWMVFDDGQAPPEADPVDMVVTEIDGMVLRAQRRGSFETKLAAAYTGKRLLSPTARHRKRVVTGKAVVGGCFPKGVAGPSFCAELCRSARKHPPPWGAIDP